MKDWLSRCKEVVNSRALRDVYHHGNDEMAELFDEIVLDEVGHPSGPDGIVGEAVDVILCMLDVISIHDPRLTMEDVESIMERKFRKWKENYSDIIVEEEIA